MSREADNESTPPLALLGLCQPGAVAALHVGFMVGAHRLMMAAAFLAALYLLFSFLVLVQLSVGAFAA